MHRFADKNSHQIFIEPEGLTTHELYPNGISTSLPFDVQLDLVHSIKGFENAHITRPGYAIEYDFFNPQDLRYSLETRHLGGLFFAGQINGTTGYEEAAAQGLLAGLNAALQVQERDPWCPRRDEAYLGVLVDDLVTRGVSEPYRMFTSRAEFRILLRQDNADLRLTPKMQELGMHHLEERMEKTQTKLDAVQKLERFARDFSVDPDLINPFLTSIHSSPLSQKVKLESLIMRPNIHFAELRTYLDPLDEVLNTLNEDAISSAEVEMKYSGYIKKEEEQAQKHKRLEEVPLGQSVDYTKISSLSFEGREKLIAARPMNIGQASRISGVSPADISVLLVHMGR